MNSLTARSIRYFRLLTSGLRRLPDFVVVGAMKAGTSSLASYLFLHPQVSAPRRKEIHFFDSPAFARGVSWYRSHFPFDRKNLKTGEASPYYLCHPHCPERMGTLLPDAKLIVMLRNPVDRAFSHYNHQVRRGREPLSFEAAVDSERDRLAGEYQRMVADPEYYSHPFWAFSYLTRGHYAEQLERWLRYYPREKMLIMSSDAFFSNPQEQFFVTLEFLGLKQIPHVNYPQHNAGDYDQMEPRLRQRLNEYFEPHNRRLERLLDRDFDWC